MSKKEKLLNAAVDIFSEKGLEKATVSDITAKAGVGKGTFYLYFSSKMQVVPEIADALLQKIMQKSKKNISLYEPFDQKIEKLVDLHFQATKDYKKILKICYSSLAVADELTKWEKIYEPYYEFITELLEDAKAKNEVISTINTKITARLIVGSVEEAAEQLYIFNDDLLDIEATKKELIDFLRRALQ